MQPNTGASDPSSDEIEEASTGDSPSGVEVVAVRRNLVVLGVDALTDAGVEDLGGGWVSAMGRIGGPAERRVVLFRAQGWEAGERELAALFQDIREAAEDIRHGPGPGPSVPRAEVEGIVRSLVTSYEQRLQSPAAPEHTAQTGGAGPSAPLSDDGSQEAMYVPEKIIASDKVCGYWLKVKWMGYPVDQATWEQRPALLRTDAYKDWLREKEGQQNGGQDGGQDGEQ